MTDEKPKRVRGQKEREAAYRQGFADGLKHADFELGNRQEVEAMRERAMVSGLMTMRATPVVKRTRRTRKQLAAVGAEAMAHMDALT